MALQRLSLAAACALILSACGGIIDPSKNRQDAISGTLQVGGSITHQFNNSKNGEVEVTITSIAPTPASGTALGVAIGQVTGGSCVPLLGYVTTIIVNRKLAFGLLNKGDYCATVFDTGVITVATTYQGTLSHP